MKLKIALSILNDRGSSARIENEDDDSLEIVESYSDGSGKKTCLSAAKALRDAAAKFEALALEEDRFKCTTHDRINSGRRRHGEKTPDSEPRHSPSDPSSETAL